MVPLRFISFVTLMLVLIHVTGSTGQTHQVMKKSVAAQGSEIGGPGRSSVNVGKVTYDGAPAVAMLGGRKRMFKRGSGKEMTEEGIKNRGDSISGKDIYSLNKRHSGNSQEPLKTHGQNDRSVLKAKSLESADLENSGRESVNLSSIKPINNQDSKFFTGKSSLGVPPASSEKPMILQDQSDNPLQNLEYAHDEIVKLMSKDYRGQGGPRHNPPINNNEPQN